MHNDAKNADPYPTAPQSVIDGEAALKAQVAAVADIVDRLQVIHVALLEYLFDPASPKDGYCDSDMGNNVDRLLHEAWTALGRATDEVKKARYIARKDGGL